MLVPLFMILNLFPVTIYNVGLSMLIPRDINQLSNAIDMDKKNKKEILKVTYGTLSWGKEV